LRTETNPNSETSFFLFSRIPDDGKKSKSPVILCVYTPSLEPLRVYFLYYVLNFQWCKEFDWSYFFCSGSSSALLVSFLGIRFVQFVWFECIF
jgi:hypothetical protein